MFTLREYQPSDCKETAKLFYETVHTINAKDYTKEQLNVWATKEMDLQKWNQSLLEHTSIVAIHDKIIVGFGDIDKTGYFDRLFVHKDWQNKGIACAICNELENTTQGKIVAYVSITAKGFFEKRAYTVIKQQQVQRQGVLLTNFIMEKRQEEKNETI